MPTAIKHMPVCSAIPQQGNTLFPCTYLIISILLKILILILIFTLKSWWYVDGRFRNGFHISHLLKIISFIFVMLFCVHHIWSLPALFLKKVFMILSVYKLLYNSQPFIRFYLSPSKPCFPTFFHHSLTNPHLY